MLRMNKSKDTGGSTPEVWWPSLQNAFAFSNRETLGPESHDVHGDISSKVATKSESSPGCLRAWATPTQDLPHDAGSGRRTVSRASVCPVREV